MRLAQAQHSTGRQPSPSSRRGTMACPSNTRRKPERQESPSHSRKVQSCRAACFRRTANSQREPEYEQAF